MDSPDPEGFSLLAKLIAAASFILIPAAGAWNWLDKRFARKHQVANDMQAITSEIALRRGDIKELFQSLADHSRRDEQLFRELMTKMGDNHSEIMRELGRKADRK